MKPATLSAALVGMLGWVLLTQAAQQRGDSAQGESIAVTGAGPVPACVSCHGEQGQGNADLDYPMLAGLQSEYLQAQLKAYAEGTRQSTTMQTIVRDMTTQQMCDAAAYYASLEPAETGPSDADDVLLEQGRRLYRYGKVLDWGQWLPACYLCHGARGQGAGTAFPPLAGQHDSYIETQLDAWQQGTRGNDPNGLMTAIAARLEKDDIRAVAAYLNNFHRHREPIAAFAPKQVREP